MTCYRYTDITRTRTVRGIGDTRYVGEPRNISCIHRTGEGRVWSRCTLRSLCTRCMIIVCIYVYVLCVGLWACIGRVWHARVAKRGQHAKYSVNGIDWQRIFKKNSLWYKPQVCLGIILKGRFRFQISDHTEERRKHNGNESCNKSSSGSAIETDAFDLRARMMSFKKVS